MSTNFFTKLFANPLAAETGAAPAGRDIYVTTQDIDGLEDLRDPDLLWDEKRILRSARGQTCLKQVLDGMRYRHGGKLVAPASVCIDVSAETVERDRRFGGRMLDDMREVFCAKHQASFGDALPQGMQPRYLVRASTEVPVGRMRVRTGPAIHVPGADEKFVWKVQTSRDGIVWDEEPPILLAEQQRLFILSGRADNASQVSALWPFEPSDGLVLLNLPGESRLDMSSEPLGRLNVTWREELQAYVLRAAPGGEACLYLRTQRLQPVTLPDASSREVANLALPLGRDTPHAPALPATDAAPLNSPRPREPGGAWPRVPTVPGADAAGHARIDPSFGPTVTQGVVKAVVNASAVADELTLHASPNPALHASGPGLPSDEEFTMLAVVPVRHASLSLEGLAVQRPSLFSGAGVRGLQWGVTASGGVVAPASPAAQVRFTVDAQDHLEVSTSAGTRALALGEAVPLKGGDVVLRVQPLPAALKSHYLGWMRLPLGSPVPIAYHQAMGVGRHLDSLRALQPLAAPGFLKDEPTIGGDRMGLSRHHLEFRATDEGLEVQALGQNTVAHLDEAMQHLGTITHDEPATLKDGHCLVVGHYVWRFRAQA